MNKKLLFTTIFSIIILSLAVIVFLPGINNDSPEIAAKEGHIILFYGESCPHCVIIKEYIERNNVAEYMSLEQKEVYHNENNANDLINKAKVCGVSTENIAVPFLWDGSECFIGGQKIIEFFEE